MADINLISELVGSRQFEEAKTLIKEALEEDSNNIEVLKLAGLVSVNLEEWINAKKYFETVVKFEMEDATSWFYLANSYEHLGDFISAKNAYFKVIELRPEYIEAYKNLCVIILKSNNPIDAIPYAEKARELNPEEYLFDFIIGTIYMKEKDFATAVKFLDEAYKKSPDNLGTLNALGTSNMVLGNHEVAIGYYKKVIELYPQNPAAYFNLGSAYQIQQKHEEAIELFKKAVELDDEDESFINALAMSEVKVKDFKNALIHYRQLALLCPNKDNYKYNMATCYEALGEIDTAIHMLEGIVFINPKYTLPAQKLANLYLKTNQLGKAKEIYDKVLLKNNVTADIMHQYAVLSSSLCDTDTAEKMLKKAIRLNPNLAKAHKDLAIVYLNKRLFEYAEDEFKTALELAPKDFEILFEYGNYLYSISKNIDAEKYYLESLEVKPENVLALTFLGLNSLILNKLDEAKNYIMRAINIEPNHEYIQFCTGRILFACGEYEDAKRYLVSAVAQNPDIETQNTLALTYEKLGDFNQAINIFKNIESKAPQSISVLMDIARCYEKLGENDNALEYLDKVVAIFPDNEDAHEMIRKLS